MNKQLFLASLKETQKSILSYATGAGSIFMVVNLDIPFNGISERFK